MWSSPDASIEGAFSTHGDLIATEVLAETISEDQIEGETFTIGNAEVTLRVDGRR